MSEPNGGFAFGSKIRPDSADGDDEEIEAIEVSGEPVSRSEAKSLGLVSLDPVSDPRDGVGLLRKDELPADISPEQAKKLQAAWEHLKQNDIEQAMTLAQEVVFEYPTLVAAKLIIARCFINRKQHDKALAILQAIPDDEKNAETYYYIGICQNRQGKIKEAIDSLKLCRSTATDNVMRKRANDLLLQLQGEQTVCPVCGKKTLYESMVQVGDQTVCSTCAKTMPDAEGDGDEYDDAEGDVTGTRRRKRLRPPLTKYDILIRLVFFFFLVGLCILGVYLLYILSPGYYAQFRSFFPNDWAWLPQASQTDTALDPRHAEENQKPRVMPSLMLTSPSLIRAVVGMKLNHKLNIEGMDHSAGKYYARFYPEPAGSYSMDTASGEFEWTPVAEDAGKAYEITFHAVFPGRMIQSRDQINTVIVSPGPVFKPVWTPPDAARDRMLHLTSANLDDTPGEELLVATGEYWSGEITVLKKDAGGEYQRLTGIAIPGRPAGVGVIRTEGDNWVAVPDYWYSRVRYYSLRGGNLAEMSQNIDLPGRPLVTAFDSETALLGMVCRTPDGVRVVAYRQSSQRDHVVVGDWTLPEEFIWRRLFILRNPNPAAPVTLVALGNDMANSVFTLVERQGTPRPEKFLPEGVLIDAALGNDGQTVHCLFEHQGRLEAVSFTPGREQSRAPISGTPVGRPPMLAGFAVANLATPDRNDFLMFSSARLGMTLGNPEGKLSETAYWPLPAPARLFGDTAVTGQAEKGDVRVMYTGADGAIWSFGLPKQ